MSDTPAVMPQPITEAQIECLELIRNDHDHIGIVSSVLDGDIPVVLIAHFAEDSDEFDITPLAIMLEGTDLFSRLTDPATGLTD